MGWFPEIGAAMARGGGLRPLSGSPGTLGTASDALHRIDQALQPLAKKVGRARAGVQQLDARAEALGKTAGGAAGGLETFLAGECAHVLGLAAPERAR